MTSRQLVGSGEPWLPILLYHNIGPMPLQDPFGLTIAAEQFEQQMRCLVRLGYQTIWPSDWIAARRDGKPLPKKPVIVTFDDGYADIVEHAFPILWRYGLKAAAYVVTKRIGLTNTWDEVNGHRTMRLMSAKQICEWARRGIEFGSHTRTHPRLTSLSAQQLIDEIEGSRKDLQNLLGTEVLSFAYPYGDGADSNVVRDKLMRTCLMGMTVWDGPNSVETNPYEMRRVIILPRDSTKDFERKLRFQKTLATHVREHIPLWIKTVARFGFDLLPAAIAARRQRTTLERFYKSDRASALAYHHTQPGNTEL